MNYRVSGWIEGHECFKEFCSYGDARTYEANLEAAGAENILVVPLEDDFPF